MATKQQDNTPATDAQQTAQQPNPSPVTMLCTLLKNTTIGKWRHPAGLQIELEANLAKSLEITGFLRIDGIA